MSRKVFVAACGVLALAIFASSAVLSVSSAASDGAAGGGRYHKSAGLTARGIANAQRAGTPSTLVRMAPQSSLRLLSRATRTGRHAAQSIIHLTIGLKLRNVERLKSFLRQVQNPASPVYHEWLTPAEFTARYGPSKAQVAQVVQFLKARNITVDDVSTNRVLIHTEAMTATYERAFGIMISDYELNGRSFYSTADGPRLPRGIALLVSNVLGLNGGMRMHPLSHLDGFASRLETHAPPAATTGVFNPHQIAKAYDWPDITDTDNGAGVSIAIMTAATPSVDTNPDYHTFWADYDLPDHDITVIPIDGAPVPDSNAEIETALDVEWSAAMAPGASLTVYVASTPSLTSFTDMYNQLVLDNNTQVMTTSWGIAESGNPDLFLTDEQIFMEAAAQGISMFAASGDHGASDCAPAPGYCPPGPNNADYPSASKYVTAANGTELTVADVSGTYAHEHAWSGTGGAISQLFRKPSWQVGPGVPDDLNMRMNSDMALNAGPLHPYLIYVPGPQGTGYYGVNGTSAVAPILAGLFAIGVSQQPGGARLGQSNRLVYSDVNASDTNYGMDFHDVTVGCNGYLPDGTTPSCAGTGWDHPTGWGSPRATSLLSHLGVHGPAGTLQGRVTASASGSAVAGASVQIVAADGTEYDTISADDGGYSKLLPTGNYTVTVSDFGYKDGVASVSIADGQTTTRNFSLNAAPKVTLSGKVSDGSGHGYPLYARIQVETKALGQVASAWTNPETGKYSLALPKNFDYTLNVTAALAGYHAASATLTLVADATKNFALTVTDACTAPGYVFGNGGGFGEDFNNGVPPSGWTVTNAISGSPIVWQANTYWGDDNYTGGTGTTAESRSDWSDVVGNYSGPHDTSLVTPPISVASLNGTFLRYKANFDAFISDVLDLDISTDGGNSWTTILNWDTGSHGAVFGLPGENVQVDLAPYLPASGTFELRWRNYNTPSFTNVQMYAQIDDVVIGSCEPSPGGLVMGQVKDANTAEGIVGAHVVDDQGPNTDTVDNPADPNLPRGFYLYFASPGIHHLTVSALHYSSANASVSVANDEIVSQNFALDAPRLEATPDGYNLHVMVNSSATASLALANTGTGRGSFRVMTINAPPPPTAGGTSASVIRIPVKDPMLTKQSIASIRARAMRAGRPFTSVRAVQPRAASGAWNYISPYPTQIGDNAAARDPATGKVYSVGGTKANGAGAGSGKEAYVYDPGTDAWSPLPDAPVGRDAGVAAFLYGKFYVVDGWGTSATGDPVAEVDIYDAKKGTWSTGTPNPVPAGGGAAAAMLNGALYIVGGCNDGVCGAPLNAVQVYHLGSDSWSSAADYPQAVAFASCGAIDGKLYCAGGVGSGSKPLDAGYVYDPATDSWSPIENMPDGLYASFYTAANGSLLIAGGFANAVVTNEGFAYDPQTDSWSDLPPLNQPTARGGHACGLYQLGGFTSITAVGSTRTDISEVLPGYVQDCGQPPSIPWLTVAPQAGTLQAGAAVNMGLTFNGDGQKAFTTSKAYLSITGNTPYGAQIVPLTVHWDPEPVGLVLTGKASPDPLQKGGNLAYTLTVLNKKAPNNGAATETMLIYKLPNGVSYVASSGDAGCTLPPVGSSPAPGVATGGWSGVVACDFGTLAQGASKTVTIAVRADQAGTLDSYFAVSSREPNDSDKSALDIKTTVIGTADLSASAAGGTTITEGSAGPIKLGVANAGPDPATNVQFKVNAGENVKLTGVRSSQGGCTASGHGAYTCDIGEIAANGRVEVTLTAFGISAGTATVQGQALTSADDPDQANNVTTARVTVKAASSRGGDNSGGGGGALGWLALAALLGLALAGAGLARARKG